MSGRRTIFHLLIGVAFVGAVRLSVFSNDGSKIFAQDATRPQGDHPRDPSSTPRPLFQELNKESQSLFRDVAGSVVRVQLPLSESAMVDDPLQKWTLRLDPQVRREIDEIARHAPQNSISRVDVQPATTPSDSDSARGGQHIIMLQVGQFSPNCIGVVFDDQQHLLIPQYVEKDAFDGPVTVQLADGRIGWAQFVASDRLADLTILQLNDLKGKAAVDAPDQPENGALLLVMSLNSAFNRLAVWEGWEPDYTAIITIDSRIAGFTKGGRFLSADAFTPAARQLIANGVIRRPVLGIKIRTVGPDDPQRLADAALGQTPAIRVMEVQTGSAADHGGLRPGDIILTLAGKSVGDALIVPAAIADLRGKTELTVLRDGRRITVTVDLQVQ